MSNIILVDMRSSNGHITAIMDDNENIAQFENIIDVVKCADGHPLCENFPWISVNMDELEIN